MNKKLLIILLLIVAVRVVLLHDAVRSLPDEYFYNYSLFALKQLHAWNIKGFLSEIFTAARPGYNVIMLVPASLQALLFVFFDLDPRSSFSLLIPQMFNAVVAVFILLIYYKILSLYIERQFILILGVLVYALLVHNTVYTAHLFPYNYASCIVLWLIYRFLLLLKRGLVPTNRQFLLFGTALAWSFLIYPGYYLIIPFFFILFFILFRSKPAKAKAVPFVVFSAAFFFNLFLFQVLSLVGNTNYYIKCSRLSKTILQGSFEEGFTFIGKYFNEVEHLPFVVVIISLFCYLVSTIATALKKKDFLSNGLFLLFVYCLLVYLYSSVNIFFLHKQVNYGRLLELYYPVIFVCIFVVFDLFSSRYALFLSGVLLVSVLVNLASFYYNALTSAYPLALVERYRINIAASEKTYTHQSSLSYISYDPITQNHVFGLLNFSYFYNISFNQTQVVPWKDTIFLKPHFLNLKAYQYEGMNIHERRTLDNYPIYTGIFRN